jgi:hypothetical protein
MELVCVCPHTQRVARAGLDKNDIYMFGVICIRDRVRDRIARLSGGGPAAALRAVRFLAHAYKVRSAAGDNRHICGTCDTIETMRMRARTLLIRSKTYTMTVSGRQLDGSKGCAPAPSTPSGNERPLHPPPPTPPAH